MSIKASIEMGRLIYHIQKITILFLERFFNGFYLELTCKLISVTIIHLTVFGM